MTTFVATHAIKRAVEGHEREVLEALGIPWRKGRPHISCPYPTHPDKNPSWRWDEGHRRAYCTCIESGSHSIFDVVMHCGASGFDAAKIRVAELLGRQDLIRGGEGNAVDRGRMSATKLLNPPRENRDDQLPITYLAHRLGVAQELVPLPRTPVVGLKSLPYYDAPSVGSGADSGPVGEYPCAVFGTESSDGWRHAHRIYLASGGRGKANLGNLPNGAPRDPKKSATKKKGENTNGVAVIWGDPEQAFWIILTEGIETGAAVSFLFSREISAGELAVAAAITAGGVEAFQPYPATRRVTIGADRDEDESKADGAGFRRGEKAAREFAARNSGKVDVAIALPGIQGESVDWLDVLLRDGPDKVRAGITHSAPFVPTITEQDGITHRVCREQLLKEIAEAYPLPSLDTVRLAYKITRTGRPMVYRDDSKAETPIPVATPFTVAARLRHADRSDSYGLRVAVQGMDGIRRDVDVDRGDLGRSGGQDVRAALLGAGLRTEENGDAIVIAILKAAGPEKEIIIVDRPGWHRMAGLSDLVFVEPGGAMVGLPADCQVELASPMPVAEVRAGTIEGWREAVSAACGVQKCSHWVLGVLAGFAGPIIALTGLDTCGINLSGQSSGGKTLAQRLTVSAWTSPDIGVGLLQSMRTTENAIEALAEASNGSVLALDEMGHADGKMVGRMIYGIASGIGKARATKDAQLQDRHKWATFAILSGEIPLETKVTSDGGKWTAGMAVRILDIDTNRVNRSVPETTLRTIDEIRHHYGHAGPAFVAGLIAEGHHRSPELLRKMVLDEARKIAGKRADSARIRAAEPLAVLQVAGSLAVRFGILAASVPVDAAVAWAWDRFSQSSDARALSPGDAAIANIRRWIAERLNVTIKAINPVGGQHDGVVPANNREAVGWYDAETIYLTVERAQEAAGQAIVGQSLGRLLSSRGLLSKRTSHRRVAIRHIPGIGKIDAYALRRSEFGPRSPSGQR